MSKRCLNWRIEVRWNCRRASIYTRCRSVGAWMGTRGCICEIAIIWIAGCALFMRATAWIVPKNGAKTLRWHQGIRLKSATNISFHSVHKPWVCELGVFRFRVSIRRLDRAAYRPSQAFGVWLACSTTRRHQPSNMATNGTWTKLQINQPLTAQR